ncbi:VanZ family protein [Simiduia agarivorans]|uniref:VanZ-like domain-containing protein n=1 Tax=Simiduia agarivorans (strain DSM 21679 / JCM 13881 / BCRC 17597 / SA1) TaxID=1117647 RepID=K4KKB1_SIMAS|nr:VanZ family protein [Simiduia agarivorans]AFU98473.1 hypothetical protein M5M_06390 [Simiduia agarivorans SA1 = DSM 21679]
MLLTLKSMPHRQLALLAMLLLMSPWFFIGGPDYYAAPLYRSLWNAGHLLFFSVLGVWVAPLCKQHTRRWWLMSLAVLTVSLCIETLQGFVGRDFSWQDVYHNLVGFALGALWAQAASHRIRALQLCALLLTTPLLWTLVQDARLHWRATTQFPIIADFESEVERQRVQGTTYLQRDHRSHGQSALAIQLSTERYSGISIARLLGDWRNFTLLKMDIYNPASAEQTITLRIADQHHNQQYHDRFNQRLNLQPGWNAIALPIEQIRHAPRDRQMDLQHIADITLFSASNPSPRLIMLDYVRLE